jgi:hypothetical protein
MKLHQYLGVPLLLLAAPTVHALSFNLTDFSSGTLTPEYLAGFNEAANLWSSKFSDPVIVNLNLDVQSLGVGILGQTTVTSQSYTYGDVKSAFINDKTSTDDNTAVNFLPTGSSVDFFLNLTSDNPNGSGSPTPYLDNDNSLNNSTISMSTANAKALGLSILPTIDADATLTFSSDFLWDFDTSDGIAAGYFVFVGIAAHEIGHALGFISNVDMLDFFTLFGPSPADDFPAFDFGLTPLDLFRYSEDSCNAGGYQDWSADTRDKFFSIDGCTTSEGLFSTGANFGDGSQASHWKDGLGLGLMKPIFIDGEIETLSGLDLKAFDVIGWNSADVPTPPVTWLIGSGLIGLLGRRKHKR